MVKQFNILLLSITIILTSIEGHETIYSGKHVNCFSLFGNFVKEAKSIALKQVLSSHLDISKLKNIANATQVQCQFDLKGTVTFNPQICVQDLTEMIANITSAFNDISEKKYYHLLSDVVNVILSYEGVYKECIQDLEMENRTNTTNSSNISNYSHTSNSNQIDTTDSIEKFLNGETSFEEILSLVAKFNHNSTYSYFEGSRCYPMQKKFVNSLEKMSEHVDEEMMNLILSNLAGMASYIQSNCDTSKSSQIILQINLQNLFNSILKGSSSLNETSAKVLSLIQRLGYSHQPIEGLVNLSCSEAKTRLASLYFKFNIRRSSSENFNELSSILKAMTNKCV